MDEYPLVSQQRSEEPHRRRDPFEKVPFTITLISQGYSDHEVRKRLLARAREQGYRSFSRMSCDRIIRCATLAMRATLDKEVEYHRANVSHQLYEIARDNECSHKDRINALKTLSRLLGLNHEQEVALFGEGSMPRFEIVTSDWRSRLHAARDAGELKTVDIGSVELGPPSESTHNVHEPIHEAVYEPKHEPKVEGSKKSLNGHSGNGHNGNGNGGGHTNGQTKKPK